MPKNKRNSFVPNLAGEDVLLYKRKEKRLLNHFKPELEAEKGLIREIAYHRWIVRRALRWQDEYFIRNNGAIAKDFSILIRYQTQNDAVSHRLIKLLLKMRKRSAIAKNGFVSQKADEPQTLRQNLSGDCRQVGGKYGCFR